MNLNIYHICVNNFKKNMRKPLLLIPFLLIPCLLCQAQDQVSYQVGFAKMSIDPPNDIFGLALAGYGVPAEGRFSTTWELMNSPMQFKAISSNKEGLLVLDIENKWHLAREEEQ